MYGQITAGTPLLNQPSKISLGCAHNQELKFFLIVRNIVIIQVKIFNLFMGHPELQYFYWQVNKLYDTAPDLHCIKWF